MKARTAERLYKFTDAVTFFGHCSVDFANLARVDATADSAQLDHGIMELERALENVKSAKAMLKDALDKEDLA